MKLSKQKSISAFNFNQKFYIFVNYNNMNNYNVISNKPPTLKGELNQYLYTFDGLPYINGPYYAKGYCLITKEYLSKYKTNNVIYEVSIPFNNPNFKYIFSI